MPYKDMINGSNIYIINFSFKIYIVKWKKCLLKRKKRI